MLYRHTGTPESRAAQRARFSAFFTTHRTRRGLSETDVSAALGVSLSAVRTWTQGGYIPNLERLAALAELLELDLDAVLEAAGKPPLGRQRSRYGIDPGATLAGMLRQYRNQEGLANRELADRLEVSVYEAARFAAGSAVPSKLSTYVRMAAVLKTTVLELLDAADLDGDARARRQYVSHCTGLAGLVRRGLTDAGFELWSEIGRRRAAKTLGLPVVRLDGIVTGRITAAELVDCQRLARLGTLDLVELLEASGWTADEARTFADATKAAKANRRPRGRASYETVGELLRAYRLTAGLTQRDVAATVRIDKTSLTRYEADEQGCEPRQLARLAAVVGAPLDRLLLAAGWAV
jgi:transcriptional regulator with XRE-family HTH domain